MDGRDVAYIDVDAVMVHPSAGFLPELNRLKGTHYKPSDITTFNYRDCFPREHAEILEEMWTNPTLYDSMRPDVGVTTAIRKMRRFARVVALSSPTVGHIDSKFRFLSRPPLLFAVNNIIIARDKSIMRGAVLIDDNIDNLLNFDGARICFSRPWNEAWSTTLGYRTDNWKEIVEIVGGVIVKNTHGS